MQLRCLAPREGSHTTYAQMQVKTRLYVESGLTHRVNQPDRVKDQIWHYLRGFLRKQHGAARQRYFPTL
jgi:hypothetical protein